jgi:hypothetical protein
VVLAPQCLASSSREAEELRKSDGGKRKGSPRRAPISRKPSRREGRCDHRLCPWFSRSRNHFSARGPRVQRPPRSSLRPPSSGGPKRCKARAKAAARRRTCVLLLVIARGQRAPRKAWLDGSSMTEYSVCRLYRGTNPRSWPAIVCRHQVPGRETSVSLLVMNSSSTGMPLFVFSMPRLIAGTISSGAVMRSP